jgi:2-polyprenyl-3-methyl-5-hydroxy-6-metoxy-1,4-benzoquinol methylase
MAMTSIEYSARFRDMIAHLHRGKETWANYHKYVAAHLGGPHSRLVKYQEQLVPEIEHRCGPLAGRRVLDFGCGTGATTVALASRGPVLTAFDVDEESLTICGQRLREHGLDGAVRLVRADDLEAARDTLGTFDVILLNGVIEHIPLSIAGLRRRLLRTLFGMLAPGGSLFIADTPNRLYPFDFHSTQLWWIPWMRPGSRAAYDKAVRAGRHAESPTHAPGPVGLEQVGAWGATYREVMSYFDGLEARCGNLEPGQNRYLHYALRGGSWKRRVFEAVGYWTLVGILRVPLTAVTPSLSNLVIRRS